MQVNAACSHGSLEGGIAWEIFKRHTHLFIRSGLITCHHRIQSLTMVDYVKRHRLLLDIVCAVQGQDRTFSIKKEKRMYVFFYSSSTLQKAACLPKSRRPISGGRIWPSAGSCILASWGPPPSCSPGTCHALLAGQTAPSGAEAPGELW